MVSKTSPKTRNLSELNKEIQELTRQAEEIIAREKADVILDLTAKIKLFGITAEDVGFDPPKRRGRPAKSIESGSADVIVSILNEEVAGLLDGSVPVPEDYQFFQVEGAELEPA